MHQGRIVTAAVALLFCGSVLGAAPEHAAKEERNDKRTEGKRNATIDKNSRSIETRQRTTGPTPLMRQNTDRTPPTAHPPRMERPTAKPDARPQQWQQQPIHKEFRPQQQPRVRQEVRDVRRPIYRRPPPPRPLPYYHRPGYVIRSLPSIAVSISLGGLLFYYADGIYYRHLQSGFVVSVPPLGLIVPTLPIGYAILQLHGGTYYYYANVYYIWDSSHRGYRVVEAPGTYETYRPGDVVHILPDGAYSVTIDGVQYYRYEGIYFMQTIQNDRIVYVVVTP